jgi:hypothetical protein
MRECPSPAYDMGESDPKEVGEVDDDDKSEKWDKSDGTRTNGGTYSPAMPTVPTLPHIPSPFHTSLSLSPSRREDEGGKSKSLQRGVSLAMNDSWTRLTSFDHTRGIHISPLKTLAKWSSSPENAGSNYGPKPHSKTTTKPTAKTQAETDRQTGSKTERYRGRKAGRDKSRQTVGIGAQTTRDQTVVLPSLFEFARPKTRQLPSVCVTDSKSTRFMRLGLRNARNGSIFPQPREDQHRPRTRWEGKGVIIDDSMGEVTQRGVEANEVAVQSLNFEDPPSLPTHLEVGHLITFSTLWLYTREYVAN